MLDRVVENGLLEILEKNGVGFVAFSPLAQGVLSDRYLKGIPADSRAAKAHFLKPESITPEVLAGVTRLNEIAWREARPWTRWQQLVAQRSRYDFSTCGGKLRQTMIDYTVTEKHRFADES
jgi:L-glyceraldehyde 3-phosphate reductase